METERGKKEMGKRESASDGLPGWGERGCLAEGERK
jgi:hypothetical protein